MTEFEDTKGVIKSRKSKNRQYNGQKEKDKKTTNGLHKSTSKIKIDQTNPTK